MKNKKVNFQGLTDYHVLVEEERYPAISVYQELCHKLGFKVRTIDYKNQTIDVYSSYGLTHYTLDQLKDMAMKNNKT